MEKQRIMPEGHWDWPIPTPLSQGWRVGNTIWVGGQVSADQNGKAIDAGDIEAQTRNVFENIKTILNQGGAEMKDIVKLNTFYVCNETGDAQRLFWEKMTKVRLEYIADPGPAATAIPVPSLAIKDLLIEVDAVAIVDE